MAGASPARPVHAFMLPDILFKGIPRTPTRTYTTRFLAKVRPSVVAIPCCGSFSLAYAAVAAGVEPSRIDCGDISLYSTALGRFLTGEPWRLDLLDDSYSWLFERIEGEDDLAGKAAAVLFVVRLLQYTEKKSAVSHHQRERVIELTENADHYLAVLRERLTQFKAALAGVRFRCEDLWETIERSADDERAVILANPPRYTGGYDRMFRGVEKVFSWDEPSVPQFTEAEYERLGMRLAQANATALVYYASQSVNEDPADEWGAPWVSLFADKAGASKNARINWITGNRKAAESSGMRAKLPDLDDVRAFKLFDGEISPDSDLRAIKVPKPVGDYYRDLFIHRLPGSQTEVYILLTIDGCVAGVIGAHLANYRRMARQPAHLTFAFTCPHPRYDRLHKLTLMAATSTWFWEDVLGKDRDFPVLGIPCGVQTAMLTRHPENKTARGVMKMLSREKQSNGEFKLTYAADLVEADRRDTLKAWQTKHQASKT